MKPTIAPLYAVLGAILFVAPARGGILIEGFDNIAALAGNGWVIANRSEPAGSVNWFQGDAVGAFSSHEGAAGSYIAANFNSTAGVGTISNWLITPYFVFANGDSITFYTRTAAAPAYADRLQVRFSAKGASADVGLTSDSVGDFDELLLEINPSLAPAGYPSDWTEYTAQLNGLSGNVAGRLAFRYFVTDGGPEGDNSDYIGIDSVTFHVASIPEPSTAILAAAGLAALAVARARGRRSHTERTLPPNR